MVSYQATTTTTTTTKTEGRRKAKRIQTRSLVNKRKGKPFDTLSPRALSTP